MTKEELERDCEKFHHYLTANGVKVFAHIIYTDVQLLGAGTSEMIDGAILCVQADRMGLKVVPK